MKLSIHMFDQDLMSEKSQIDNQNKIEIDVQTINKKSNLPTKDIIDT